MPTRLLFSSRHVEEIIYRDELDDLAAADDGFEVIHTLTRSQPPGWTGYARRIDERMLAEVLEPLGIAARAYICGPTALVEVAAERARPPRPAARSRPDRALRTDRDMTDEEAPMIDHSDDPAVERELDGNASAGLLDVALRRRT